LILEDAEAQLFLEYLGVSLASIIHGVTIKLFQGKRLPIGIDKRSQFITRTVPATPIALHYTLLHLSVILSLPSEAIHRLWNEDEHPSNYIDGAFPSVENALDVGNESLINAYGGRIYTIDQPSEVIINSGEIKSVVLLELANSRGVAYKAIYRSNEVSFGYIRLQLQDSGDLLSEHFSTNTILGYLQFATQHDVSQKDQRLAESANEFVLVATLIRDFFICENRDAFYSSQPIRGKSVSNVRAKPSVRYLPRFRVRYIGSRALEYESYRRNLVGHHVTGHLRRCRSANPLQLRMAEQFGIPVPDGFTFVRPHDRGGHEPLIYRSRSAMQLIYS
jgi:hypothetical protein